MVAAVVFLRQPALRVNRAAELAAPDDQRFVQQAARLQVFDQAVDRLVDVAALVGQAAGDVRVRVPVVQVNLNEAHAAFDHPPGQQHRVAEGARLLGRFAVELVGRFGFVRDIGQFGHAGLHAEGQLVLLDAGVRCGIAHLAVVDFVQFPQPVERRAADLGGDAVGVVDVKNRIAAGAEGNAGVLARQIAGRPQAGRNRLHLLGVGRIGHQHDEGRQIVIHRAQAVGSPCAQARTAGNLVAGLHVADGRLVVDGLGVHAADEANVVDVLGQIRQQFADPHAGLSVLGELEHRGGDGKPLLAGGHRREPLAHANRVGQILVEPLLHLGLIVEQVHLRRPADHVQIDDVLGLGCEVRAQRAVEAHLAGRGGGVGRSIAAKQRRQRGGAQGIGSAAKKLPAGFSADPFGQ